MSRSTDDQMADLVEREPVIDACYRYAAAVDRTAKDPSDETFAAYADTITEDCVVDYGPFGCFERRDDWIAFARGLAQRAGLCQHFYTNFFVEIDRARAPAEARARQPGALNHDQIVSIPGGG